MLITEVKNTGQELLDSKMIVNSAVKAEAEHCARCIESKKDKAEKERRGENVPKREQTSHCHCSLVEVDSELLAKLRNYEPHKKEDIEQKRKAKENAEEKKELQEKKENDQEEAERDLQKEIADMKRRFQEARVTALKEKKDVTKVKIPKKRIAIEKVGAEDQKKKKLAFLKIKITVFLYFISNPIHNFEAHFCASKVMEFLMKIEGYGYFWALFLKGLY